MIAREVTKLHEEFLRGHIDDLVAAVRKKPPRGEITLLIGLPDERTMDTENGASEESNIPLARRVEEIMLQESLDQKAALKKAARERGLTRREAYRQLLIARDELDT
jgi:16S rRNA (cytidine1402-2'-O)-methyltransferase